jgi:eukaryotic-like serine/threonine-protein kinase
VTQATDLYATGIVLYEMLTGYLPFNGPTSMATMLEHIQSNPVPPSQRLPGRGITPAMDSVVLQALAKQPDRRFNSARAMKQAVNNVFGRAGSETTVATPAAAAATQVTRVRAAGTHQARSAPVPPPGEPSRGVPVDTRDAGAGVNSAVKALLIVILLGVFAAGAWLLFDNLQDDNRGTTVPPTETVEVTEPDPTATDAPAGIIEPVGPTSAPPTETPEPTETPQPTPEPTETPVPTPQPTLQPAPTSTPETGVIEPLDITPIPTQPN